MTPFLHVLKAFAIGALALTMMAPAAIAETSWDTIRGELFKDRAINDGAGVLVLKAPLRPEKQSSVPIGVDARLTDGRSIKAITIVIDENPSPVATVLRPGDGRANISVNMNFRFNRKTNVRAIVEASDGQLYMQHAYVRYSGGQSACSAPPNGDAETIAANMGKMRMAEVKDAAAANSSQISHQAKLEIKHPNYTGMQMDQITLLYWPLHIVKNVEIRQGDDVVLTMENGISVSEDPVISFNYEHNGSGQLTVVARDTEENVWEKSFPVGTGS